MGALLESKHERRSSYHEHTKSATRARSASRTRKPLPRKMSSPRLMHTVSAESLTREIQDLNLNGNPQEVIEVPFVKAHLDPSLPEDYLRADVIKIAQALKIPKWHSKKSGGAHLNPEQLKLTRITGALTNAIFKVEYRSLPSLLLRVYGPNVDSIIDRDYELQVLARLSSRSVGPSLYGCFTNGRFEQFLENSTTLTNNDIRDWHTSQRIARRMKELHVGVPLTMAEKAQGSICWHRIEKWLKIIGKSQWSKNDENMQQVLLVENWETFKHLAARYQKWLKIQELLHKNDVFCHNDAQCGNLLFTSRPSVAATPVSSSSADTEGSLFPTSSNISVETIIRPSAEEQSQDSKLVVIDFEYSGPGPAPYDLANHLSEWMGDYNCAQSYRSFDEKYPNKEQILNFIYSYVAHKRDLNASCLDDEVRKTYNEVIKQRPSVSLHWCLWGIMQSGELEEKPQVQVLETGTLGEKYVITTAETTSEGEEDNENFMPDTDVIDGVDIDTFQNLLYSADKMRLFWGDLVQLGLIKKEELLPDISLKYLDVNMI
ncbi:LAMI_0H16974g1_1 [Lachancea mirantina]|uniref:LAMI_0H16974g1_1 n=1 Tax=Lachancea mirantina TaxID=1230905 RepID=A0A1G4KJ05_9SACH|nr:LAMI_0H16974g1_1 [Lachancea mirantina]